MKPKPPEIVAAVGLKTEAWSLSVGLVHLEKMPLSLQGLSSCSESDFSQD